MTARLRCRHKNCKIFKLSGRPKDILTDAFIDFELKEFGKENHVGMLAQPVTGLKKKRLAKDVKKTTPRQFVLNRVHELSPTKVLSGNIGYKISDSYARKLRSEAVAINDFSKLDFEDLKHIQKDEISKNENFIQNIFTAPFHVILINEINLKLLAEKKGFKIEDCILHIDATGSVVRKLFENQKQIYFYSICIRCPPANKRDPGSLIELAAMISSSHTQISIGNFLSIFKMKIVQIFKKWPVFKDAVSDFSYATVNAMLLNFNSTTLTEYLQNKFQMFNCPSENNDLKMLIEIHLCAAHFFKNFVNIVKSYKFGRTQSRILKQIFGTFFRMHDWDHLKIFLRLFIQLISNPSKNDLFFSTFESIEKYVSHIDHAEDNENKDNENKDNENSAEDLLKMDFYSSENEKTTKSIFKNSPFYRMCNDIQQQFANLLKNSNKSADVNPFYNLLFLEELKKKMFAFIPLWINVTDNPLKVSEISKIQYLMLNK